MQWGTQLQLQTVGETPWAGDMPPMPGATPDKIMHATLTTGDLVMMAADMMDPSSFQRGDTVGVMPSRWYAIGPCQGSGGPVYPENVVETTVTPPSMYALGKA